jgi:hypothetical protein
MNLKLKIMTINTRKQILESLDLPTTWTQKIQDLNPNDRLFITTDIPISMLSIEELEKIIEDRKADAIISKAKAQLYEALDILKTFGADVDIQIIGLDD